MAKKKKTSRHLVSFYIEGLHREILEKHMREIKNYSKGKNGIYALYSKKGLYYVGLASSLSGRINTHLKDRHEGLWDRFSMYLTEGTQFLKEMESLILRIVSPEGNRTKGKLKGATNLSRELARDLRHKHKMELHFLTGKKHTHPGKMETHLKENQTDLVKLGIRSLKISGKYKGKSYKAIINKDGWICLGRKKFSSLSSAAIEITGRPTNGWSFWRVLNPDSKKWQQIDKLR